jgi:hypothetical protein
MNAKNSPPAKVLSLLGKRVAGPILTVSQIEDKHPALQGRMRGYIMRADLGLSNYEGLSVAVIRVGRTVMLDESAVLHWLESRTQQPKSRPRNPHGRVGKHPKK